MPPKLAFVATCAFIVWAYRRDGRDNPYTSRSLWVPILWMMRCGSRGIDYWLGGGEGGRLDPILILALIVVGFFVLARRQCNWSQIFASNGPLILFYGYLALSLTWAGTVENPAIKIMRPLGDLIMALIVVTEANPRRAIETLFRRTAILLIPLSIILIKYFPYLGRQQDKHWGSDSWIGVTTHKNPLGQLCMVAALGFIWTMIEASRNGQPVGRQKFHWLYLGLTGYLFFGGSENSRSSTAIFCCGLALAIFFLLSRIRHQLETLNRRIVVGIVLLAMVAIGLQAAGSSLQAVTAELQGKNADLTGRTFLWKDVVRIGMKHPMFGAGYGGFWVPSLYPQLSPEVDNAPAEAHNGYLETFADLGLIGVGLLFLLIFQSIGSAIRMLRSDFEYGRIRLALLIAVIVMNYSEATFPRGTHLWWFGFLVVAASAAGAVYQPGESFAGAGAEAAADWSARRDVPV